MHICINKFVEWYKWIYYSVTWSVNICVVKMMLTTVVRLFQCNWNHSYQKDNSARASYSLFFLYHVVFGTVSNSCSSNNLLVNSAFCSLEQ